MVAISDTILVSVMATDRMEKKHRISLNSDFLNWFLNTRRRLFMARTNSLHQMRSIRIYSINHSSSAMKNSTTLTSMSILVAQQFVQ